MHIMISSRTAAWRVVAPAIAAALLAACGGGASGSLPVSLPAQLTVNASPRAEPGSPQAFSTSLGPATEGLAWHWDFGDGTTSTAAQPSHAWTRPGDYTVSVSVRNSAGQAVSAAAAVQVGRFDLVADRICSGPNATGWCWQAPLPSVEALTVVNFATPGFGIAAGRAGFLQSTHDGGRTWTRLPRTPFTFANLVMLDASIGWGRAFEEPRAVMHTRDGGASWRLQPIAIDGGLGGRPELHGLRVPDATTVIVESSPVAENGEVFLSTDGGERWRALPTLVTPVLEGGVFYAERASGAGRLGPRHDRWTYQRHAGWDMAVTAVAALPVELTPPAFGEPRCRARLIPIDTQRLWAHCASNDFTANPRPIVYRSDDGGASWRALPTTMPEASGAGWTFDARLDAAGEGFGVLAESAAFGPGVMPGQRSPRLLRASAGATRWAPPVMPAALASFALPLDPVLDARTAWIVDTAARAHWTDDGGATWQPIVNPAERERPQRLRRDPGGGLVAEYFEDLSSPPRSYRSTDRGQAWHRVPGDAGPDPKVTISGLWFFDARRGLATASDGSLRETRDGGRSWHGRGSEVSRSEGIDEPSRLAFSTATRGWLLDRGTLKTSADAGQTWTTADVPAEMAAGLVDLQFVGPSRGWASTRSGRLYRSDDGGQTWRPSPQPEGLARHLRFADDRIGVVQTFDSVFFESVWHTRDGGQTWTGTNYHRIGFAGIVQLHYADADNVWMIGNHSSLESTWHSGDGGATWRHAPVTPGARPWTRIHFADTQRGWVAGPRSGVFATTDGGRTWQPQATSLLTVGVTSMFWLDAATGWLGGTSAALLATATGGR